MSVIFTETHVYKSIPISCPEMQTMTAFRSCLTDKMNRSTNLHQTYAAILDMFPVYSSISDAECNRHSLYPDSDHLYIKMNRLPGKSISPETFFMYCVSAKQCYHAFLNLYLLLNELGKFGCLYTDLHLGNLLCSYKEDCFQLKLVDFTDILLLPDKLRESDTFIPTTRTTLLPETAVRTFYRKCTSSNTHFDDRLIRRQLLGILLQLCQYDNLSILSFFEGDTCHISQTHRHEIEQSLIALYRTWNPSDKRTGILFKNFIDKLLN